MKKLSITIISLLVFISGLLIWQNRSFSQVNLKYPSPKNCSEAWYDGMQILQKGWEDNLNLMVDQEKPTSEMVEEAFSDFRTYRCWLSYLCETVRYSGFINPAEVVDGFSEEGYGQGFWAGVKAWTWETWKSWFGARRRIIPALPGCQDIDDMELPPEWTQFTALMAPKDSQGKPAFQPSADKFPYIPYCHVDPIGMQGGERVIQISDNYNKCRAAIEEKVACDNPDNLDGCFNSSVAFLKLEKALKKNSADQKTRALENKLTGILTKMKGLETHVLYFKGKLNQLDQRLECIPPKCD